MSHCDGLDERPQQHEYSDREESDYSRALKAWAQSRHDDWNEATGHLSFWDQLFLRHADSYDEYRRLRRARLAGPEGAVLWVVQRRIQPS